MRKKSHDFSVCLKFFIWKCPIQLFFFTASLSAFQILLWCQQIQTSLRFYFDIRHAIINKEITEVSLKGCVGGVCVRNMTNVEASLEVIRGHRMFLWECKWCKVCFAMTFTKWEDISSVNDAWSFSPLVWGFTTSKQASSEKDSFTLYFRYGYRYRRSLLSVLCLFCPYFCPSPDTDKT